MKVWEFSVISQLLIYSGLLSGVLWFLTFQKVRTFLRSPWRLESISWWFHGAVKAFEIRTGQKSWINATQLGVEAEIRCNFGMGSLQEMMLHPRGKRVIPTTGIMTEAEEVYSLPMMVAGTGRYRFVFDMPQALAGKTYVMRLEAKLGNKVSKSSAFPLSVGDYSKVV